MHPTLVYWWKNCLSFIAHRQTITWKLGRIHKVTQIHSSDFVFAFSITFSFVFCGLDFLTTFEFYNRLANPKAHSLFHHRICVGVHDVQMAATMLLPNVQMDYCCSGRHYCPRQSYVLKCCPWLMIRSLLTHDPMTVSIDLKCRRGHVGSALHIWCCGQTSNRVAYKFDLLACGTQFRVASSYDYSCYGKARRISSCPMSEVARTLCCLRCS